MLTHAQCLSNLLFFFIFFFPEQPMPPQLLPSRSIHMTLEPFKVQSTVVDFFGLTQNWKQNWLIIRGSRFHWNTGRRNMSVSVSGLGWEARESIVIQWFLGFPRLFNLFGLCYCCFYFIFSFFYFFFFKSFCERGASILSARMCLLLSDFIRRDTKAPRGIFIFFVRDQH